MKKIEMVDLHTQYAKIKSEVNLGIQEVLDTATFIKGGKVFEFQKDLELFLGVNHVIPVGNGTDALQIALMGLGLKKGDEVIVPTFTFIATAEVVALLGLTPILVDVNYDDFNISVEAVEKAITPRTKAIVPVHLFGQNADMESILDIARKHHLYVVEDACQSMGSEYTFSNGATVKSGCMGDVGCTSFFPSKNLGCYGDGGAIFTNDDALAARMQAISNHGMVVRYHHDFVGVNSRLDSIQAAVLDVKLKHLETYVANRQKAATYYTKAFHGNPNISVPTCSLKTTHSFHQYTIKTNGINRDMLQKALADRNIPSMVYYPVPLHLQKAYQNAHYKVGDFPIAERLSKCVLSLPMHTELDEGQLEYITKNINELTR